MYSTEDTVAFFRQVNGCAGESATERLPDLDPDDGSTVAVIRASGCASGAPVTLVRIEGGGHRIPGEEERLHPGIDRLLGKQNHDVEAAEMVWAFFKSARAPVANSR